MENQELIKTILTSTVIASALSILVSSAISLRIKSLDYRNEYYKNIIDKRLEAYKYLETQIAVLKNSVNDDQDGRYYHLIFENSIDKIDSFYQNLMAAFAYSLWIEDDTVNKMNDLNRIFLSISNNSKFREDEKLIELGKDYYKDIQQLRKELEICVRNDLLKLHNIKKFRKAKTK